MALRIWHSLLRELGEHRRVANPSDRMVRLGDIVIASGRLLALVVVLLVALLDPSSDLMHGRGPVLAATLVMLAVGAVPLVMLILDIYPGRATWILALVDSLFSLVILYLGGPGMFQRVHIEDN